MPGVHDVFDDEEMQRHARRQVSRITGLAAATVALTLFGAALALTGRLADAPVVVGLVLLWGALAAWTAWRLRRLRRRVWCVRLSPGRLEGYDYARRKIALDWADVRRLDVGNRGLVVFGPGPCRLEVPAAFNDYVAVAHLLAAAADTHGVPLYVDGRPWQQIDVSGLLPLPNHDPFGPRPGSAV